MAEELPERYFYNRNKIVRIGQILKDVFPKRSITDRTYNQVREAWRRIAGDDVCKYSDVTGLKNRVLYVNVESAALIHHLTNFEKHAIIARINEIVGTKCVEDIRFKAGMIDEGRR
ncbi:MAG: DUF721 domain-containing protein [Candidatus Brocadia sp. AMX2]|uniref:DUF721 domain-containing protein n=1 Tax=Candidatus Brocadia sinica JPN1 TaxID=1197129 RepID=A0ABQ0JVH7_9BACT|nr:MULTISPECIES: DUF721 domain-containing protein [Brocadia]KXK30094.1 MAG: hypothetical protein UZ01_01567 [Candidatus Brocadia sinica]MBC6930834.1 DUF721 domain-containing protein [Candidatus Brocadia sp.]MBL1167803.1 DUF721 domain-containing protein [Candidatus Brocadia sp. AMX1]NOG41417.1 DUF721 domain-containing protein [Planctomycetota bacterium]KAA0245528.1 MAG: DUF721 domain-containing protein [Candidatus Brocadia sp. AMX2]